MSASEDRYPTSVPDDLEEACYALTGRLADHALPLLIEDRAFVPVHALVRGLMARHHPKGGAAPVDLAMWGHLVRLALRAWMIGPVEQHEWASRVREAPADWGAFAEWCADLPRAYGEWAAKTAKLMAETTAPGAQPPSARARCLLALWRELEDQR